MALRDFAADGDVTHAHGRLSFPAETVEHLEDVLLLPGGKVCGHIRIQSPEVGDEYFSRIAVILRRTITVPSLGGKKLLQSVLAEQVIFGAGLAADAARLDPSVDSKGFELPLPASEAGCQGFPPSVPDWVRYEVLAVGNLVSDSQSTARNRRSVATRAIVLKVTIPGSSHPVAPLQLDKRGEVIDIDNGGKDWKWIMGLANFEHPSGVGDRGESPSQLVVMSWIPVMPLTCSHAYAVPLKIFVDGPFHNVDPWNTLDFEAMKPRLPWDMGFTDDLQITLRAVLTIELQDSSANVRTRQDLPAVDIRGSWELSNLHGAQSTEDGSATHQPSESEEEAFAPRSGSTPLRTARWGPWKAGVDGADPRMMRIAMAVARLCLPRDLPPTFTFQSSQLNVRLDWTYNVRVTGQHLVGQTPGSATQSEPVHISSGVVDNDTLHADEPLPPYAHSPL